MKFGWLGIDVFFFLSGFLLYLSFGKAYQENKPGPSLISFYRRRLRRIVPAYYAAIFIMLIFGLDIHGYGGIKDLLAHLFFLQNIFSEYTGSINGVFWTLGLEFQFYLILPFIVPWFHGAGWKTSLICIIAAVMAFKAVMLFEYSSVVTFDAMYPPISLLAWRLDEFAIGVAFSSYWLTSGKTFNSYLLNKGILSIALAAAGFALLTAMIVFPYYHGGIWTESGIWSSIYRAPIISASIGLIIMGVMYSGILKKIIANPVIEFIGVISYSLYIWHYPVIVFAFKNFSSILPAGTHGYSSPEKILFISIVLVVSITGSLIFYILFERPFLKWRHGYPLYILNSLFGLTISRRKSR